MSDQFWHAVPMTGLREREIQYQWKESSEEREGKKSRTCK